MRRMKQIFRLINISLVVFIGIAGNAIVPAYATTFTLTESTFPDQYINNMDSVTADGITITFTDVENYEGSSKVYVDGDGITLGTSGQSASSFDITFDQNVIIDQYTVGYRNSGTTGALTLAGSNGTSGSNDMSTTGTFSFDAGSIPVFVAGQAYTLTHTINGLSQLKMLEVSLAATDPSPGGVAANLRAWWKADAGTSTTTDGASVSQWDDQSGNGHDASHPTTQNQPTYQSEDADLINFNPVIRFDGIDDVLDIADNLGLGGIVGSGGVPLSVYALGYYNDGDAGTIIGPQDSGGSGQGAFQYRYNGGTDQMEFVTRNCAVPNNCNGTPAMLVGSAATAGEPLMLLSALTRGDNTDSNIFRHYFKDGTANSASAANGNSLPNDDMSIGGSGGSENLNGDLGEVIVYNRQLTAAEQTKVFSYLALKYGVTKEGDYVASDDDAWWNAATNSAYHNDVAGIGRDDDSGLDQRKSKSIDDDAAVTVDLGVAFSADLSCLIWGNDDASTAYSDTGAPTGKEVMGRTWKVAETGTVGSVTVTTDDADATHLLVDSDENFSTGATEYPLTSGSATVDLSDGDFFTFAKDVSGPTPADPEPDNHPTNFTATADSSSRITVDWTDSTGTNLPSGYLVLCHQSSAFPPVDGTPYTDDSDCSDGEGQMNIAQGAETYSWTGLNPENLYYFTIYPYSNGDADIDYKTDGSPATDSATTPASKSPGGVAADLELWLKADGTITYDGSGVVTNWDDETGNHKDEDYQGFGSMSWEDEAFNFNPKVSFDGSIYMRWEGENFLGGVNGAEVFYTVANNGDNAGFPGEFSGGTTNNANYPATGDVIDNFGTDASKTWTPSADLTKLHIYNALSEANNWQGRLDGSLVEDDNANTTSFGTTFSNHTYVGARHDAVLNADIPEVILYKRVLTADERQKVGSYLAFKYGITKEGDYVASGGATLWDATANADYHNDVAGIVRDDASGLHQPKSKSINDGAILTVFHDAYSGQIQTDQSAFAWGNNGLDTAMGSGAGDYRHMNRIWKASDSATFGAMIMSIPNTFDAKYMLVDGDTDFSDANAIALADDGSNLWAKPNIEDGQYFTFATDLPSPGGASDNLALWLKANDGVFSDRDDYDAGSSPAADGDLVQSWQDMSYRRANAATDANADVNPPAFKNNDADNFNFNPVVQFDGTDDGLDFYDDYIFSTNDGMTILAAVRPDAASGGPDFVYDFGLNADRGYGLAYSSDTRYLYTADDYGGIGDSGSHNRGSVGTLLTQEIVFGSEQRLDLDGTSAVTNAIIALTQLTAGEINESATHAATGGPFTIGRQSKTANLSGRLFQGAIGEIVVYDDTLPPLDLQKAESYLALKWGITKEDDYIASDGVTKFWDAAANAAYHNNVAGIVRDDDSDFFQPKSKSVGEGAILTGGLPSGAALKGGVPVFSFPGDKYALVWGHNGGDTQYEGTEIADTGMMVMNRKWKVEDNGVATAGRNGDGFGPIEYSIPAATNATLMWINRDGDANFATGTVDVVVPVSAAADPLVFVADVADGQVFTFARPVPPAAPSGLTATPDPDDNTQVDLEWTDNSGNETGFEIERSTSQNGPFAPVATVGAGETEYTDGGLDCGATYYYRVRAVNAEGNSAYTSVESATTVVCAPAAPSGLNATPDPDDNTQVDLEWTDNSGNETGFEIERSTSQNGPFAPVATVGAGETGYTDGGLDCGATYHYRVRAVNAEGNSAYTSVESATTVVCVPAAPSGLTATPDPDDNTQVDLEWTDNSGNETGFEIERSTSQNGPFAPVATVGAGETGYTDGGLDCGATYYYRVRAVNAGDNSAYTSVESATTGPCDLLEGEPTRDGNVVDWPDVPEATGYQVYRNGQLLTDPPLPEDQNTYLDTEAEVSVPYTYEVLAILPDGTRSLGTIDLTRATIPTLSEWGMLVLSVIITLLAVATISGRRRVN